MSYRERNKGKGEEKEYENSTTRGLDSKSVSHNNGSIEEELLTIDENLLIDPKLLFIGSKIGEGAHGRVYEGRSVWQSLECIACLKFFYFLYYFIYLFIILSL